MTSQDEPAPKEEPPVMPTAEEAAAMAPSAEERPVPVRYAFVLWVLAGIVGVLNGIVLLANKQRLIDQWTKTKASNITDEQVARGASTLLWTFLVAAVVFAVLFALFAYKALDAVRRARLMLTTLCVLTVVFYFFVLPTTLGLMVALISAIATVLLFLPAANRYFTPRDLPT